MSESKSVLYIAYHFPPILGSSGVHRTLAFTRFLQQQGWQTTVLTASLKAYDHWEPEQLTFIPAGLNVIRAFARNTAKDLSFRGKYLSWMALPDNWQSWIVGGVFSGLKAIKRQRPDIIVSTYPIASAHLIAYILHKITGIPWVADFRDPMAQDDYPTDKTKRKLFNWIEKKAIKHCQSVVLTAPGAVSFYQNKYPQVAKAFWQLVPNGFDQEIFNSIIPDKKTDRNQLVLLHSGVIYPSERDPSSLFKAIAALKESGLLTKENFQLRLRATGHDQLFQPKLHALGIDDLVSLEPSISYKAALKEILTVDGLLLLQADNCNHQIPAKAYEYIKAKKPILALTSELGDTGKLLTTIDACCICPLDDETRIKQALSEYLQKINHSQFTYLNDDDIFCYSRQYHAQTFEQILNDSLGQLDDNKTL